MPFFSFMKPSRAQVVEKKPIVIGLFVERCTPADLENRVRLIPLEDAQRSNTIKLRSVIPYPDTPSLGSSTGTWEDDPSLRQPSTLCQQPHVQKRSVSGTSTATTDSVDSVDTWTADCSLLPEVFDYYVCHKRAPPADDSDDVENSDDFTFDGDSSESCWSDILMDDTESLEAEEAPSVVPVPPRRGIVRLEETLIPLETAFLRSDVRFRPEGFELEC